MEHNYLLNKCIKENSFKIEQQQNNSCQLKEWGKLIKRRKTKKGGKIKVENNNEERKEWITPVIGNKKVKLSLAAGLALKLTTL